MSENIKFCKDCKFFKNSNYGFDECKRTTTFSQPSMVTGHILSSVKRCGDERYSYSQKSCGAEAKFFEPNMKYKVITFVKNIFKYG